MGEWLKPTDLKSVKAARSSGVRIPLPPPYSCFYNYIPPIYNILKIMSRSPKALRDSMKMYLTIMHGPSDLSRAQREMMATVVSQVNQCHY